MSSPGGDVESLGPLAAEVNKEDYTLLRVQKSHDRAKELLNLKEKSRKVTPLTEKSLNDLRESCDNLLQKWDHLNEASRGKYIEEIRDLESGLYQRDFEKEQPAWKPENILNLIVRLRRLEYYAQYGDYAAVIVNTTRSTALNEEHEIAGREQLGPKKHWKEFADILNKEIEGQKDECTEICHELEKDKQAAMDELDKTPLRKTIRETCKKTGFNFDAVLFCIHNYAERNDKMHSPIGVLKKTRNFSGLAERLCEDRKELGKVIPADKHEDIELMRTTIDELINLWFDGAKENPGNRTRWTPSKVLMEEVRAESEDAINKKLKLKEQRIEDQNKKIARDLISKHKLKENDEKLVEILTQSYELNSLPEPGSIGIKLDTFEEAPSDPSPLKMQARSEEFDSIIKEYKKLHEEFMSVVEPMRKRLFVNKNKQAQYHNRYGPDTSIPPKPEVVAAPVPSTTEENPNITETSQSEDEQLTMVPGDWETWGEPEQSEKSKGSEES